MPTNTYNRELLEYNFKRDKEELKNTLLFLRDMINVNLEILDDPKLIGLNSLGIFQGNAVSADIMAARIKLQYRILQEGENSCQK